MNNLMFNFAQFFDNVFAGSLKNVSIGTKTGYNRVMFYMLAGETAASISFDNIYYGLLEDGTLVEEEKPEVKDDATGDYYLSDKAGTRVDYDETSDIPLNGLAGVTTAVITILFVAPFTNNKPYGRSLKTENAPNLVF
jgi:hypothetical protein